MLAYTDEDDDGVVDPQEVIEDTRYFPYGMKRHAYLSSQSSQVPFAYNGAEQLVSLPGTSPDALEALQMTTFRTLAPEVALWGQTDPKAIAHPGMSPYQSMGSNPISNVDPNGDLHFLVPIAIGAVVGGAIGGKVADRRGTNVWHGIATGAMIGAGMGLGVSWGISAGTKVSGIYLSQSSTTFTNAYSAVSNALVTSNVNIASAMVQGRTGGEIAMAGGVGLLSGGIGGYFAGLKDLRGHYHQFLDLEAIRSTNQITSVVNGGLDRFTLSLNRGEGIGQSVKNGLFGAAEGYYASRYIGRLAEKIPGFRDNLGQNVSGFVGRHVSAGISTSVTSVPGMSSSLAYYHNLYGAWTDFGSVFTGRNEGQRAFRGLGRIGGFIGASTSGGVEWYYRNYTVARTDWFSIFPGNL